MSKKKQMPEPEEQVTTKAYFYVSIVCAALGAVFYGLMFTAIGIYGLIAGIVFEICALGFSKTQTRKNPVKYCKTLNVVCYVLLFAGVAFMIGGIIYSSLV